MFAMITQLLIWLPLDSVDSCVSIVHISELANTGKEQWKVGNRSSEKTKKQHVRYYLTKSTCHRMREVEPEWGQKYAVSLCET